MRGRSRQKLVTHGNAYSALLHPPKQVVVLDSQPITVYRWWAGSPDEFETDEPPLGISQSVEVARKKAREASRKQGTVTVTKHIGDSHAYVTHFTAGRQSGVHGNSILKRQRAALVPQRMAELSADV